MSIALKKIVLILLSCFVLVSTCQISEAVAVVDHKEIKQEKTQVFIPSIKKGADKTTLAKINSILYNRINNSMQGFTATFDESKKDAKNYGINVENYIFSSTYAVKFNKNDLFSIAIDGYQYTGGAHGYSWRNSLTVDLKTDTQLSLGDLFQPNSSYKEVLDKKIKTQIAKQYGDAADEIAFTGVADSNVNFFITEEVLVIYYQQYELAAYVFGAPTFIIPIDEIDDLFNWDIRVQLQ